MTTKWAHLPNAVHIDHVLVSLAASPTVWDTAWEETDKGEVWGVVGYEPKGEVWEWIWDSVWDAVSLAGAGVGWNDACDAVWCAILALVARDDCGHLLDSRPEHVKLLAALGVPAAILLYPACVVLSKERELELA